MFFYGNDGLKMAREIFAKQNLMYVGRIHHGPNIIHSKKPIRSIEDFKDLKLRVPGGMIAEGFAAIGAKTTLLPGGEVFSALEKGTIEAADYTGPAVNWDLGFQQVTKYIWMGPVRARVDLSAGRLDGLLRRHEPLEQALAEDEGMGRERDRGLFVAAHAAIQKADMEAWPKFIKAGTEINRLPSSDLEKFQRVAVPIWFKWANKDKDAARVFKAQLESWSRRRSATSRPTCIRARSSISEVAISGGAGHPRRRSLSRSHAAARLSSKSDTSAAAAAGEFRGN